MEYLFQLIPEKSKKKVLKLLESEPINIIVTKKRISKHGDFRKKANSTLPGLQELFECRETSWCRMEVNI